MNSPIDHDDIKSLAKELGRPAKTLIALSENNDPFYIGPQRQIMAEWFADLWDRLDISAGVHIRRIHYVVVSQAESVRMPDAKAYENTFACWCELKDASRDARYLGLVPIEAFVDRRNDEPIINLTAGTEAEIGISDDSLEATVWLPEGLPELPQLTLTAPVPEQRFHIELWAEKTTMNDVLQPLAEPYGVNLITGAGDLSLTACHLFLERAKAAGRPVRILYISDFDPSGVGMPIGVARKIEFLIRKGGYEDVDVQVRPVVLTKEQCEQYRLPRTPIKDTDRRASGFEARFGEGATELDALEALHPGELANILRQEIERYFDLDLKPATDEVASELSADLEDINERIHEQHDEDIEALREEYANVVAQMERWRARAETVYKGIADNLEAEAPDPADTDWPEADEGDEDDDPLFDSTRDYVEQINRYKQHQDKPTDRLFIPHKKPKPFNATCAQCGKIHKASRKDNRFCKRSCKNKWHRAKKQK